MHSKYNSDEQTEKNEMGGACSMREKKPLGRPRRTRKIIKADVQEVGCGAWTGLIWLRKGTGGGKFKHCNEHTGYLKLGKFLD